MQCAMQSLHCTVRNVTTGRAVVASFCLIDIVYILYPVSLYACNDDVVKKIIWFIRCFLFGLIT